MNWMPIETAPKDGTWILVHGFKFGKDKCVSHWYCVVQWELLSQRRPDLGGRWMYGQHDRQIVRDPQFWMYLPDIPGRKQQEWD